MGLQVALEFILYDLSVFRDSLLITSQIEGKWKVGDTKLIPYQKCISRLIPKFQNITYTSSNAYSYQCMTYLYLPFSNTAPMALYLDMWMHVYGIKMKENPNLAYEG